MASTPARDPAPRKASAPFEGEFEIASLDDFGRGLTSMATSTSGSGAAVRIPFTLPGERVRARLWRQDVPVAEGDLLEVLRPSPERIAPACPLFGACGGCQIQHLPYPSQLAWKTTVVRQQLAAAGLKVEVTDCVASPRAYGYRSKITPHHEKPRGGRPLAIGFLKVGRRHDVVDVERCPLATEGINAHLPAFRAEIAAAATERRRGSTFLIREAASGVTTDPDARVTERVGPLALEFFAREFFQNNPFLLPRLVEFVIESAAASGAVRLVDTYSGSGLFALAAATRFQEVTGVEVSAGAIAAARQNAARNDLTNVRFVAADSSRVFAELPLPASDAAVIIDPPRKGCDDKFLAQLVSFAPRAIVYVSCNPETLARDLFQLVAAGYRVRALQPFDMFPQTRHVECVAVLDRAS
jgi:23S rRNA (uracil1939-C5)-methyltransferase/tRNA (uracil-5-)-methyltransferase